MIFMMKKITLLLLSSLIVVGSFAQEQISTINKASVPPVIDGQVDEVWAEAEAEQSIDRTSTVGEPTLGEPGETTWQALWGDDGMYVLLRVADDFFFPNYVGGGESYEFDKPELYIDVNYILQDGIGPSSNQGHYQVAPAFTEGLNDGTLLTCGFNGTEGTIIEYAFNVTAPTYIAEYFIPFEELVSRSGSTIDLNEAVGFDVTIIDRDPGDEVNTAAVWSNISTNGSSWVNMDDCGIIIFDGAQPGIYIDDITLTGGDITENNGTLQIEAVISPEDASNKGLTWSVVNGTGRASVDKDGVVTGMIDGDATVFALAKDGSYVIASTTVNISNQIVTRGEINRIRNGYFDDVKADQTPEEWISPANTTVIDGVCYVDPEETPNIWEFRLQQQGGWGLNIDDLYAFSFVLVADVSDTFNLDFEDARDAVGYQRLGTSTNEFALTGTSDWTFDSPTTKTRYLFDVSFINLVEESNQLFQFMLGHHDPIVGIDSVELIDINDLERLTPDYIPVELITVSGESKVVVNETLQLSDAVEPGDATLTDVNWMVEPGTGWATIDEAGLLTADTVGSVTVIAMAKDDSGVKGVFDVSVTFPVGIDQRQVNTLELFPNPAINELNVVLTKHKSRVSIYNSGGKLMDEVIVSGSTHKFDISNYAAGVYFVKTNNLVAKFIK
jgi:hypothetical protein